MSVFTETADVVVVQVARVSISDPLKDKEREASRLTPTMEYGSYVYDTRNSKSLAQLTREALPRAEHYRDLVQGKPGCRPTLEELHEARFLEKVRYTGEGVVSNGRHTRVGSGVEGKGPWAAAICKG